jgi:rhodanese-related sulfurtransferase
LVRQEITLAQQPNDAVWTPGDLLERLERRHTFFVLDVRNRDEFERIVTGGLRASPVGTVLIEESVLGWKELGGKDEMLDSVVAYIERDLADQLPCDLPILAVCAKGDTSEFVAQGLAHLG